MQITHHTEQDTHLITFHLSPGEPAPTWLQARVIAALRLLNQGIEVGGYIRFYPEQEDENGRFLAVEFEQKLE